MVLSRRPPNLMRHITGAGCRSASSTRTRPANVRRCAGEGASCRSKRPKKTGRAEEMDGNPSRESSAQRIVVCGCRGCFEGRPAWSCLRQGLRPLASIERRLLPHCCSERSNAARRTKKGEMLPWSRAAGRDARDARGKISLLIGAQGSIEKRDRGLIEKRDRVFALPHPPQKASYLSIPSFRQLSCRGDTHVMLAC